MAESSPYKGPERESLPDILAWMDALGGRFVPPGSGDGEKTVAANAVRDAALQRFLADRATALGLDHATAAAVLFLQAYAHAIVAPALALWISRGLALDLSAGNTSLAMKGGVPQAITLDRWTLAGEAESGPEGASSYRVVPDATATLISDLMDGHLLPLLDAVRSVQRLGKRPGEGALAAAIGAALTRLDGLGALPLDLIVDRASELLERTDAAIGGCGGSGRIDVVQDGERRGLVWRRKTCCLIFHAEREKCGACPLKPEEEIESFFIRRLNSDFYINGGKPVQ